MNGKRYPCLLLLLFFIPDFTQAQLPVQNTQDLEEQLYRSENFIIPEQEFNGNRIYIDLNNASAEELEASGLFTPYQLYQLLIYREKYGAIFSIYELSAIPGFNRVKSNEIEPFVSLNPISIPNKTVKARHLFLLNAGRSFPKGEDFMKDSVSTGKITFAGSPIKTCIRYRSSFGEKFSMALTYEKDAGESFLYRKKPQFLSGYISFKNKGIIREMVAGAFKMNQGLGLVNGAGFIHLAGNLRVSNQTLGQIKAYASKTEHSYEQGLACQLGWQQMKLFLWGSCLPLSLSPSAFNEATGTKSWLDHQRTTGLYRTESELAGRDLALRLHTGIQALYIYRDLALGVMTSAEWIYPRKKALKYFTDRPAPAISQMASLHGNWQKNQIQVFGEISMDRSQAVACLLGTTCYFSDYIQGSLLLHHYGSNYRGSCPSAYAWGSKVENEQGLAFHLHVETGRYLTIELSEEIFHFHSPRYLTAVPSDGHRFQLTFQNPRYKAIQWRLRIDNKIWQTTPQVSTGKLRPLQTSQVTRLDGRFIYNFRDLFLWQTRLVISMYSHQKEEPPAFATLQQFTYRPLKKLKATVQFVQFKIQDWENRIYLYQPGLYYDFSFPAYFGQGQTTSVLLTFRPASNIGLSAKISGTSKAEENKWEATIQLQLKF